MILRFEIVICVLDTYYFACYTADGYLHMEKTLQTINALKKRKLIEDYAIAGGIAAMFYIEPILTYDLDVFVILTRDKKKSRVIDLTSVYSFLKKRKYKWKGEHIIVEGVPVQFIPVDELEEEAVRKAKAITYKGVRTKIVTLEYLVVILLRAGRKKDIAKVEKLLAQAKAKMAVLKKIARAHGLQDLLTAMIKGRNE